VKQDIIDYHWIGGVKEQSAIIKVVVSEIPSFRK
jgi:hypothetical protein